MQINPSIFREYDIRGYIDKDLSTDFAFLLGRAYANLCKENSINNISIGFDCRLTSRSYADQLAKGMAEQGINSTITGMGPTPQLYWSLFNHDFGGGIQVTGSHNPKDMNGFKISLGRKSLFGEAIQDLKQRMIKLKDIELKPETGSINEIDIQPEYIQDLIKISKDKMGERKLKVVIDAGNGVGGTPGIKVLEGLGVEVIDLYCDPDGDFPNHHPDPTEVKNLVDLIKAVKENNADFGIGFDGDADRIGVVDENGEVIFGDILLTIYSKEVLKEKPNANIIADVKCSSRLFDFINQNGGNGIMCQTGHSLVKNRLIETKGELAGEMSGHIFFKHRFYGFDDAIHCAARLVEIVSNHKGPFSDLIKDIPKMESTPEIRVDCSDDIKFEIAKKAQSAFKDFETDNIDGVRINFENGWGLIRASNTQPVLVLRFEADTIENLNQYQKLVTGRLEDIKASISG